MAAVAPRASPIVTPNPFGITFSEMVGQRRQKKNSTQGTVEVCNVLVIGLSRHVASLYG